MKKEFTYNELRGLVNENVEKVLKEFVEGSVPGFNKRGKLGNAQKDALSTVRGKVGKNDNDWNAYLKRSGDPNYFMRDQLSTILFGLISSDSSRRNESAHKLADILGKNEKLAQKVYDALSDDAFKHMRDYMEWNKLK